MKRILLLLLLAAFLTGCGAKETFEVVEDIIPAEPVLAAKQFFVSLPDEAVTPTFQTDSEELYVCADYTISKQILPSGDTERTITAVTGMTSEELEVIKTTHAAYDRYDLVWTAAGEDGPQLGRACIFDDGNYHYVLTTLSGEETAGRLRQEMQQMYDSCKLLDPDINLSTGS
ncbi:MAG: hypothetical protein IKB09_04950 [Oscillospiraceae bacterium]|nr:hypothetical protein [Oscillospiraceae bacterium]